MTLGELMACPRSTARARLVLRLWDRMRARQKRRAWIEAPWMDLGGEG